METATAEQRQTGTATTTANLDSKPSIEDSSLISAGVPSFASVYGFIREFRRPIKTLSFWTADKRHLDSSRGVPTRTAGDDHPAIRPSSRLGESSCPSVGGRDDRSASEQESTPIQTNAVAPADKTPPPKNVLYETDSSQAQEPRDPAAPEALSPISTVPVQDSVLKADVLATDLKGKGRSVAHEVPGVSSREGVRSFPQRGKDLFEATKLCPDKDLLAQWRISGRSIVDKRLRDLHLGQNTITNLRLCMLGSTPEEKSMKPTILIVCSDERKLKAIENCLKEFIKITFPDRIEFKIIVGKVRLASGVAGSAQPKTRKKPLSGMEVAVLSDSRPTIVGRPLGLIPQKSPPHDDLDESISLVATMGGIVTVGNSMFGLTVAHSLFGNTQQGSLLGRGKSCGWIESYEWSGRGQIDNASTHTSQSVTLESSENAAMDWLLVQIREEFMLPNQYHCTSDDESPCDISGFVRSTDLPDDNVWLCSGFTRPQFGILDSTPSSILVDQISYEVLSIALQYPLAVGDSGSWVVSESKVCGYIFAILDGEPWAYMLPIEPVFTEISKRLSKESRLEVDVPNAYVIESLKLSPSSKQVVGGRDETQHSSQSRSQGHISSMRIMFDGDASGVSTRMSSNSLEETAVTTPLLTTATRHEPATSTIEAERRSPKPLSISESFLSVVQAALLYVKHFLKSTVKIWIVTPINFLIVPFDHLNQQLDRRVQYSRRRQFVRFDDLEDGLADRPEDEERRRQDEFSYMDRPARVDHTSSDIDLEVGFADRPEDEERWGQGSFL